MKIFKKLFYKDRFDFIKDNFKKEKPSILEIGVFKGELSSRIFNHYKPESLVLVDPWIAEKNEIYKDSWYANLDDNSQNIQNEYYENLKKRFDFEIKNNFVKILRMKSDEFFKHNKDKFDLIYIDGNHLYEFVMRDISNSLNFLNTEGLIILDDYGTVGWWKDGVTHAVNTLKKERKIKVIKKHNLLNYHNQCLIVGNNL